MTWTLAHHHVLCPQCPFKAQRAKTQLNTSCKRHLLFLAHFVPAGLTYVVSMIIVNLLRPKNV